MANWCRYCKGSYPKYWCEVTGNYIPWGIVEKSCKNNGYKCSNYYISTATGVILKKKPNDEVLDNIKSLRDDYAEHNENCRELLDIYDIIGPSIAQKMDEDPNREYMANRVYSILSRISRLVSKEEYEKATRYYSNMVGALAGMYNILELTDNVKNTGKVQKITKTLD